MRKRKKKKTLYTEMGFGEKLLMWLMLGCDMIGPLLVPLLIVVCIVMIIIYICVFVGWKSFRMVFPIG